ncbi:AraC family ligand binding domain-containing protein [Paraburkholderia hospita]|jgi:hypothetical protein|uniref:AraC family ligand binding domain-containing protein n=1 Tax=Paraburkholderia TaxID=1822464 RepID=UPI0009A652A6|nr:AraC family ligand binding domain-containing protein [Paraburkholderia hospita]OUL96089.1 hypothetical protein CA603_06300 [Paraburkholderia hospita]SKD02850.1 hypothetical protein SAMN05445504_8872 [Burkholderia sp. CF099]
MHRAFATRDRRLIDRSGVGGCGGDGEWEVSVSEEVKYNHSADIPGLILSTARFAEFRFEPHYHLDCHIALVASGVQRQSFHV